MRYELHLPSAGTRDLTEALTGPNPLSVVTARRGELREVRLWVDAEDAKWQRAEAAVEAFNIETERPEQGAQVPDTDSQRQTHAIAASPNEGRFAPDSKQPARPRTRRAGLLALFREQPQREWRTRDLAAELLRREWSGPSANEPNKVSRTLSVMVTEREVEAVRKGMYRLRAQPVADEPQGSLEEGSR